MPVNSMSPVTGQIRVEASRETVFGFFVEPEKMVRWMGVQAQAEPQPGGLYRVVVNDANTARGEFVEIDPPNKVVFTWGWEEANASIAPGESTVEITLEEDGDATLVRLTHLGLPTEDARQRHAHGWHHYMQRLSAAAAGRDPGPDEFTMPKIEGED
jgi:uncharacterized protein YndB with AHSA1/START domain